MPCAVNVDYDDIIYKTYVITYSLNKCRNYPLPPSNVQNPIETMSSDLSIAV